MFGIALIVSMLLWVVMRLLEIREARTHKREGLAAVLDQPQATIVIVAFETNSLAPSISIEAPRATLLFSEISGLERTSVAA